jgi:hypothetical protein
MLKTRGRLLCAALCLIAMGTATVVATRSARGSDHADTPDLAQNPGQDLSDVFIFPSPSSPNNVVLVMNCHPLIGPGNGPTTSFDPNVLYQFKIDNTGDAVEDLVIQAWFTGTGPTQQVHIAGPAHPITTGTTTQQLTPYNTTGTINQTFSPTSGMTVFAGAREDPFFFDLEQFFTILPDRATPITGTPIANPDAPQATSWRPVGTAQDFLSVHQFNVLSIVIELPKSSLLAH